MNCYEKYNEIQEKVENSIKKEKLIVNLYTMKNMQELKKDLIREKPIT